MHKTKYELARGIRLREVCGVRGSDRNQHCLADHMLRLTLAAARRSGLPLAAARREALSSAAAFVQNDTCNVPNIHIAMGSEPPATLPDPYALVQHELRSLDSSISEVVGSDHPVPVADCPVCSIHMAARVRARLLVRARLFVQGSLCKAPCASSSLGGAVCC